MKRILLILALIGVGLAASSCSDWLDLKPYDGVVEEDYWKTKEDVHSMVIGCYTSLMNKNLVTNMIYWGELRADMVAAGASASGGQLNIIRGEISPDNSIVKWSEFYTTINYCNKVIEKSAEVRLLDQTFSPELHHQYVAEVTAIRSLMYFYLLRSFKDVPFILVASNSDNQDYYPAKTEESVIVDSLIVQLTRVMPNLPSSHETPAATKGRFTRWSAMALLADIYLWKSGFDAFGTGEWRSTLEQCVTLCTQIIGSKNFSLVPVNRAPEYVYDDMGNLIDTVYIANSYDVETWFYELYVAGNSVESIFEIQFPTTNAVLADPFFDLFNFAATPRTILKPNTVAMADAIFPESETRNPSVVDIRSTTYQQDLVWKWVGQGASIASRRPRQYFPHWIVYRYPDIILMQAEAMNQLAIHLGDNAMMLEAYELVKQTMVRANAVVNQDIKLSSPVDGKALEQLLLNERAREFAFEGKRWYDVLRFARRNNYEGREYLRQLAVNAAPAEKLASLLLKYDKEWFHYWPIFIEEVEMNQKLEQNEFYR